MFLKRSIAISALLALATVAAHAVTQLNLGYPNPQVNWPTIVGSGTPTALSIPCGSLEYGMPFLNIAVTPNTYYVCGADGWVIRGGSGGGTPGGTAGMMQFHSLSGSTFSGDIYGTTDGAGNWFANTLQTGSNCSGCAGGSQWSQGTAPGGTVPANTIRRYAPTSVTAFNWQEVGAGPADANHPLYVCAYVDSTHCTAAWVGAAQIATLIQSFTNCTTATWLYSPEDGACHAPGGGGSYQPSILPTTPILSTFTAVNQSGSGFTTSNNGNSILMSLPNQGSLQWGILEKANAYSTPYSVAAFWKSSQSTSGGCITGLYLYDGTKLLGLEVYTPSSGGFEIDIRQLTSATETSGGTLTYTQVVNPGVNSSGIMQTPLPTTGGFYGRWRNDGTNLYADYSLDGSNWINIYSEGIGTFINPTSYGFGGLSIGSSFTVQDSIQGFLETNSGTL